MAINPAWMTKGSGFQEMVMVVAFYVSQNKATKEKLATLFVGYTSSITICHIYSLAEMSVLDGEGESDPMAQEVTKLDNEKEWKNLFLFKQMK